MVKFSPVQSQKSLDIPANQGFLLLIKYWLGRLISTCIHLPISLYKLVCKTQSIASPIIKQISEEKTASPFLEKKIESKTELCPDEEKIPSPIQKNDSSQNISLNDQIQDEILEEEEKEEKGHFPTIVDGLFQNFGFNAPLKEILATGTIFDLQGQKQEGIDFDSFDGQYQVAWNIKSDDSDKIDYQLLYKGNFEKGLFHGEGIFSTLDLADGKFHILLDGRLDRGQFAAGMMVMDNCYIKGTFVNGEKQGTGTIHYFEKKQNHLDQSFHLEYCGEFFQAQPHGKGKFLAIESEEELEEGGQLLGGVKLISEGIFKSGSLVKGLLEIDGKIFDGEWNEVFTGTVNCPKNRWKYEGQCLCHVIEGYGLLTKIESYECDELTEYEELIDDEELTDEEEKKGTVLIKKTKEVECIYKGLFQKGELFNGEQTVKWTDSIGDKVVYNGREGIFHFEKGEIIKQEITNPDHLKYVGIFASYTLDGQGTIYNDDNEEIYTGEIKYGFPHGQGYKKTENQSGLFQWGKFVDGESEKV